MRGLIFKKAWWAVVLLFSFIFIQVAVPVVAAADSSSVTSFKSAPISLVAVGGANDTTPTCDSSGFSLSWALCPVFDLISDGAHWVLHSIVQPFLVTPPISTKASDPSFQIWSSFRIYGDIFLVIGLLVIVFGQSIGGGMIEAYTVKKVLPRLLIAAVLINLSIYIVAFLVDFSNILGAGISNVLTSPLTHCANHGPHGTDNCWDFRLSGSDIASVFGVGLVGILAGGTAIVGFLGALFFGGAAAASTAITAAFFVGLPMIFAVVAVFITLIVRKGLILLLVLSSPVAFALYCLPNTERFFKRWWDLLIEALMVYPIVIAIFGVADILSITILQANNISPNSLSTANSNGGGFAAKSLALVVAFLLQFVPLLLIPFAFRFASGALRRIYDVATTAGAKVQQATQGRREQAKSDYKAQHYAARARTYHAAREFGENHQGPLGLGRRASRRFARTAGGYNIEHLMSTQRAEVGKQLNEQIATGRDEEIRGLTANKQWALSQGVEGEDWRTNSNGVRQFKSLGGEWIDEEAVDAGHARWGNNQFAQQAAVSYEMRKALSEEDSQRIGTNYAAVAGTGAGGWGMSESEYSGAFKGAAFENQDKHLEYKYTGTDGQLKNDKGFVDEIYEKRGSYGMSQMHSNTIEQLKVAHSRAEERGDVDQQEKIAAIAETFMHDMTAGGQVGQEGDTPIQEGIAGVPGRRQASTQGAGHVAERVRELATIARVAAPPPPPAPGPGAPGGDYTDPNHAPTPNRREQK